jgi:hypothetical protein
MYSFCDWKRGYKGRNIAIQEEEDAWAAAGLLAPGIQPQAPELRGRRNSFNRSLMLCNPTPVTLSFPVLYRDIFEGKLVHSAMKSLILFSLFKFRVFSKQ